MILTGDHASADELARFRTEAEAVAALAHPNVVQVYEVGEHQGRPYFSLEFCAGGSLADRLNGTPLPPREAARLVETVARAIQHAHGRGLVHRDLKPANVLMAADGTPKVTDFGLAKRVGADQGRTATGAVLGTPSYMAPEQAGGQGKRVGPAADVYALGAILYECLTGHPPFKAASPLETLQQVLEHTPTPPHMLNPKVDPDLVTVCLKCLEKDPARRYESAEALADDLRRYRDGESIRARSYNMLDWVTRTLEQGHYDVQFRAWGTMLLGFAAVIGVGYAVTAAVIWRRPANLTAWLFLIHALQFAVMGVMFWRNRDKGLWPTSTAERQMWSLWGGFLVACYVTGSVSRLMATPGHPHDELTLYPHFATLSGLAFVVLGSSYWGGCYLLGLAFFGLALVMPSHLPWAPLEFGAFWTAALVATGLRLRRLSREHTGNG
jgi:serine/threonine-protein kinase